MIRAVLYSRISSDPAHDELAVKRHLKACRALAERNGWVIVAELIDNDISALKGEPRKGYIKLLAMVAAREVDVIVVAATSRLWRNRKERAEGFELLAAARVSVAPVTGAPLDLASASGRLLAGILGEADTWESEVKAERCRDKAIELAAAGKIGNGGPRPFGYARSYAGEGRRRKIVRDDLHPIEAPIVAELAARALAGESLYALVKWLQEQGIRTTSDGSWSRQGLRSLLSSGRIAGLREHHGVAVADAVWPAIISPAQHRELKARLRHQRAPTGAKARKHALTGLIVCQRCRQAGRRGLMKVTSNSRGELVYACHSVAEGGCNSTVQRLDVLTDYVDGYVVTRLNDPAELAALHARIAASTEGPPRMVLDRVNAAERRLEVLGRQLREDDPDTIPDLAAAIRDVRLKLTADRAILAQHAGSEPLAGLDLVEVARNWREPTTGIELKLTVLRALIERVEIAPARRAGVPRGGVDLERISIHRADEASADLTG